MPHEIYDYSLEKLDALEGDAIVLPRFDSEIAWKIGTHARQLGQQLPKPILIDITFANGQVAFHAASRNGTILDNDHWVHRKQKTVFRFGKSSFYIGRKLAAKVKADATTTLETAFFIDPLEYATHGGSVPIRMAGFDGVVAALTISGLAQEEDHLLALRVLQEVIKQL